MDKMKKNIAGLGGIMALMGVVSSALYFIDYELRLLMWIDEWGTAAAWGIRAGLIVVGAGLALAFGSGNDEGEDEDEE